MKVRKTGGRDELDQLWAARNSLMMLTCLSVLGLAAAIGNGTTAGRLRTNASVDFRIGAGRYTLASTDNAWNLSGQAATPAATYRAVWLLVDAAGATSIAAGTDQASVAAALRALPELDGTKAVAGVFVAGPATNFANALAAQGTIHNGIPDGVPCGVPRHVYTVPSVISLVSA